MTLQSVANFGRVDSDARPVPCGPGASGRTGQSGGWERAAARVESARIDLIIRPVPVEARFPKPVASFTLVLLGSVGSEVVVEATDGNVVDRASRDAVPARTGPEQPSPSFELTVKASAIAYVRFSGTPPADYLGCDEVRRSPTRRNTRAGCP